jgi:hypothetical protein
MLPFGIGRKESGELRFVDLTLQLTSEIKAEPLPWEPDTSNSTRKESFSEISQYEVMKIFIKRRSYDRTSIGIRQSFKATIADGTYVDLKPQYKYWWDSRRGLVSLTYFMGSLDTKGIEDVSRSIIEECREVYYMYTEEGKNFLKNMV